MQLGRFTIEQLNEGQFELFEDGKINRTPVANKAPSPVLQNDDGLVGINPLYITDGNSHVLVDTGLGWGLDAGSSNTDVSNIRTNLAIFGATPSDITHVILTHLHYDHAAGLSFTDSAAKTQATFPNAKCFIQKAEWDYAINQVQQQERSTDFYLLDDLYRLYADGFFGLIESEEKEIIPGITLIKTGGHTPGHQIVKISDEGNEAYCLGDLLPTPNALNYGDEMGGHENPLQAKKVKTNLLRKVCREHAYLFFYHSIHSGAGRLEIDKDEQYIFKEI